MKIVWPSGYRAWTVNGDAVVVSNFGDVVIREGEQLVNLGANEMDDGSRWTCIDADWAAQLEPLGPQLRRDGEVCERAASENGSRPQPSSD